MIALKIIFWICFASIALGSLLLAPWVPTRKKDLDRICLLLKAGEGKRIYELGCGDARLLFYAAKKYKAQGVGMEIALPLYMVAKIKSFFAGKLVKIKFGNFLKQDLSDADGVYVFGGEGLMSEKIKTKLQKELKPGAIVASYSFPVKGWEPTRIDKPTSKELSVFIYEI